MIKRFISLMFVAAAPLLAQEPFTAKVDAKLANESFVAKAPPEVVEENRERKADFEAMIAKLQAALKRLDAAT